MESKTREQSLVYLPMQRPNTAALRHMRGYVLQNMFRMQVTPHNTTATLCIRRGFINFMSAIAPAAILPIVFVMPEKNHKENTLHRHRRAVQLVDFQDNNSS